MTTISPYTSFIEQRRHLIDQTKDPALKQHYQAEIDLVESWGGEDDGKSGDRDNGDIRDPDPAPVTLYKTPDSNKGEVGDPIPTSHGSSKAVKPRFSEEPEQKPSEEAKKTSKNYKEAPDGYAEDWHTIRFSNTTDEPVTVHVTVAAGQQLPKGVDANGDVVIQPGEYVDLTFAPETSANFRTTKGDGSVWNQGEVYFDEKNQVIWGNKSYIYGANSNMRIFCEDGQHSGYQGDIFLNVPEDARVGDWGIMAPYDRYHHSDDPNNPDSATGGPNGAKNAGSRFFYSLLEKGEGYVGRGRPAEVTDYDDASSLRFTGKLAVVI